MTQIYTSGIRGVGLASGRVVCQEVFGPTTTLRGERRTLTYARVNGVEYGTPRGTAADDTPATTDLALTAGPNPARSQTTLRFTLPEASDVRLNVHDALGRTVRQLDLGSRPAGEGTASVATAGLAPGVYVVRLVAGATLAETRLTVIR